MLNGFITVKEAADWAIQKTNNYFMYSQCQVLIHRMEYDSLQQCDIRSHLSRTPMAWRDCEICLTDGDCYNFYFSEGQQKQSVRLLSQWPIGGCVCSYNIYNSKATIELIQNFSVPDSELNGNVPVYSFIAILFFLIRIDGEGIYINSPVNSCVLNYYISEFGFIDLYDDGSLLYLSRDALELWFLKQVRNKQLKRK